MNTVRGFNKLFNTPTNETYNILGDLVATVVLEQPDIGIVENVMRNNAGKHIHLTYLIDREDVNLRGHAIDRNFNIPNFADDREFADWWNGVQWYFRVDSDVDIFQLHEHTGKIYVRLQSSVATTQRIKQSYLDGISHCVFTPIIDWANKCLTNAESEGSKGKYNAVINKIKKLSVIYEKGIPDDKMTEVCEKLNIKVVISYPFTDEEESYGSELKKPIKVFRFINTRINHLELGEMVSEKKAENVSRDFIYSKIEYYDTQNIFYYTMKDNRGVNAVYTLNDAYKCTTDYHEVKKNFEKANGMNYMTICDITQPELARFIKKGTHYNASIGFGCSGISQNNSSGGKSYKQIFIPSQYNRDTGIYIEPRIEIGEEEITKPLKLIDQKKAYYNFKKCKFYEGFLGKITDFRKTDKMNGVGLYLISNLSFSNCKTKSRKKFHDLITKMGIFENHNVYTSAELNYLSSYGVKYKIVAGCWGVDPLHFDFGEEFLQKTDKTPFVDENGEFGWKGISYYAKTAGAWDSHYEHDYRFIKGDTEYAELLKRTSTNLIVKPSSYNEICIGTRRKNNNTLGHISSFIFAYQRISLLEQMLEMEIENICGVYVDGIYYREHEFKLLDTFESKEIENNQTFRPEGFITNVFKTKPYIKYPEYRHHYKTELFIGAGGNGKTHMNLTDEGLVKKLFVAPTHKLCAKKKNEYGTSVEVLASLLADNPTTYQRVMYYNVFILDEVSMMSEYEKQDLIKKYPTQKLIFCGDVGYQLPPINADEINISSFDNVRELTINYRCSDKRLLYIISLIRERISVGRHWEEKTDLFDMFIQITDEELQSKYHPEDMIITGTNKAKDKYTNMFQELPKWYITKNSLKNNNGDIIIGGEKPKDGELRHAYTSHSIQGETAERMIYIHASSLEVMGLRGFYTAVSRAKTYNQINLIKN
jgi:hypothetical protein